MILALLTALASQAAAAEAPSARAINAAATVTFGEPFEACPTRATLRRLRRGDGSVGVDELAACRTLVVGKPYRVVVPASPSPSGEVWIKVEPDAASSSLWVNARPGSATVAG